MENKTPLMELEEWVNKNYPHRSHDDLHKKIRSLYDKERELFNSAFECDNRHIDCFSKRFPTHPTNKK